MEPCVDKHGNDRGTHFFEMWIGCVDASRIQFAPCRQVWKVLYIGVYFASQRAAFGSVENQMFLEFFPFVPNIRHGCSSLSRDVFIVLFDLMVQEVGRVRHNYTCHDCLMKCSAVRGIKPFTKTPI
jgi:hypothetical protein